MRRPAVSTATGLSLNPVLVVPLPSPRATAPVQAVAARRNPATAKDDGRALS
ncbi:hypothetical protein [Actinosynnema sp. NPDC023587]|uniref:hypothetical protein n=1 Tax=Actinosynnema sp. NPDC023587 TaxID=3154695 RepID=UPI0033E2AB3E